MGKKLIENIFSILGMIAGIVIFVLGVSTAGSASGLELSTSVEFGADFYTYIYKAAAVAASNISGTNVILAHGIGYLLIALGLIMLCVFGDKILKAFSVEIGKGLEAQKMKSALRREQRKAQTEAKDIFQDDGAAQAGEPEWLGALPDRMEKEVKTYGDGEVSGQEPGVEFSRTEMDASQEQCDGTETFQEVNTEFNQTEIDVMQGYNRTDGVAQEPGMEFNRTEMDASQEQRDGTGTFQKANTEFNQTEIDVMQGYSSAEGVVQETEMEFGREEPDASQKRLTEENDNRF